MILGITKTVSGSPFNGLSSGLPPKGGIRMGNSEKGSIIYFVILLTALGTVASVAGVILTIVFRIRDKRNHEIKESNRQAKG